MDEYPRTVMEFETQFKTEKACREYLLRKRQGRCIWRVPLSSGKLAA